MTGCSAEEKVMIEPETRRAEKVGGRRFLFWMPLKDLYEPTVFCLTIIKMRPQTALRDKSSLLWYDTQSIAKWGNEDSDQNEDVKLQFCSDFSWVLPDHHIQPL